MITKWMWGAVVACALTLAGPQAGAQEMSFRSGVVTGITPVQVAASAPTQAAPSRTGGALGRALGRAAGRAAARVTGDYSYDAYTVAHSATEDIVGGATAVPGAATVTAFMVMLRFDDGTESAIRSARADHLRVGARARVFGSGASAQIVAE